MAVCQPASQPVGRPANRGKEETDDESPAERARGNDSGEKGRRAIRDERKKKRRSERTEDRGKDLSVYDSPRLSVRSVPFRSSVARLSVFSESHPADRDRGALEIFGYRKLRSYIFHARRMNLSSLILSA